MFVLDIGCGEKKMDGAVGVDRRKTKAVDVIADATRLPFKPGSFDRVYSAHTIEHFSHREIRDVAIEWVGVLKLGGQIEIRCPWLRIRALLFFLKPTSKNVENIYGGQEYEGNFHKCGFSFGLLKNLLESVGIRQIKRVFEKGPFGIPHCSDLHIIGTKSELIWIR